jgi:hypothetical protein
MNNIPAVDDTPVLIDAEFVKLTLSKSTGGTEVVGFSTSYKNETIDGTTFHPLNGLMGVGTQQRDLGPTGFDTAITIVGVDQENIYIVLQDTFLIKGSLVQIYRGFYDENYVLQSAALRYTGLVTSWAITETVDMNITALDDTYTVTLNCSNYKQVLQNHISGRNTNPNSWKGYSPTDTSMDNVPNLINAYWNFGVPKK